MTPTPESPDAPDVVTPPGVIHPVTPTKKLSRRPLTFLVVGVLSFGLLLLILTSWLLWRQFGPAATPVGPVRDDALVIEVDQTGFYRLTTEDLAAAGLTLTTLSAADLALTDQENPVPFLIQDEALIFYGQAPTSQYTAVRPYILQQGEPGVMMTGEVVATDAAATLTTITQTLRLEENKTYQGQARTHGSGDVWFWQAVQIGASVVQTLTLPSVSAEGPASLTLHFWGSTYNNEVELDHDLDLLLNGQAVGSVRWDGQIYYTGTVTIPPGVLHAGDNFLTLDNSAPGATLVDIMYLDWLELHYPAPPQAVNDRLEIAPVSGAVTVSGFSAEPLLFNLADPQAPTLLGGWTMDRGRVPLTLTPDQQLVAIGPTGSLTPNTLRGLRSSDWTNPANQADLLIITTDELAPALVPLETAREAQGIQTAIVPLAELVDAFTYGESGPETIRAFLRFAQQNWTKPRPRYVLLVGDASTDFRDYLGQSPGNLVPTLMIPVTFSGETISDTGLADLDGDGFPDMALGRWPVDSPRAVADLVERTLAYEQGVASARAVFSADGTEDQFPVFADSLISQNGFTDDEVVRLYGQPTAALANAWNEGAWLLTYNGHGSLDMWGKEEVFTLAAVSDLRPQTNSPIVLQFTCLTGLFAHPFTPSISETMLAHEDGPILIVAATSLTLPNNQEPFAQALIGALRDPATQRMGDALLFAQQSLNQPEAPGLQEIVATFGLLGDPSALIVRPQ